MTRPHRFAALHGAIMNIECVIPAHLDNDAAVRMAYRVGHRDARHAAAELAAAQDALVDELVDALWISVEHNALHFGESHNTVINGRALLAKLEQTK